VFQGAEHSRFTHSLGVMHTLTRALRRLSANVEISEETQTAARAAALLHDIGHGPFSHVMERAFRRRHESWTAQILRDPATETHRILAAHHPTLPETVVALMQGRFRPNFVAQLISSQLDCDRFDYLLRDSLMTGVKYGCYDLEWILHALAVSPEHDALYVRARGKHAIEEYVQARYYMFRQVYFHHTLRAAENMLMSILRRAVALTRRQTLRFTVPGSAMDRLLRGRTLTTQEYLELDDCDLTFFIKRWREESDPILSDISRRLLNRRLFKSLDLPDLSPAQETTLRADLRKRIKRAGFDPDYYLLWDNAADVPYFGPYAPDIGDARRRIFVESGRFHPRLQEISETSEAIRGLRRYQIRRICFPPELQDAIIARTDALITPPNA
jgi:hypothetical protein